MIPEERMTDLQSAEDDSAKKHAIGEIADRVADVAEEARGATSKFVGEVKDAAASLIDEQKGRAAETVHTVASALRRTAETLHGQNEFIARYAERAADQVDRVSDAVRERQLGDVIAGLDDLAHRSPALFFLGAVGAGFIVGRLMTSRDAA
jgi:hypothetical protein